MNTRSRRQRGSLLIVAMIFAAIIAISLTSYLKMATTALNLSQRAFLANDSMNLTESGLEQAMSAINSNTWASPWTTSGSNATASFSGISYGQGATGVVKVYIQNYSSTNPLVVAKGVITPANGSPIVKEVEVSGIVQRGFFSKGLVGKHGLSFSGNNASVDSWNSHFNDDGTARGSPVGYSAAVKHDKGSIAAIDITATDAVQNADIYGTAAVGSSNTGNISVGPNGLVGPFGTAAGTKNPSSISGNFTENLPAVTTPTPSATNTIAAIGGAKTLPGAGDVAASDGKYYYSLPSVSMSGNSSNVLTISANKNVVLLPTAGSGTTAISLGGNASISITSGATLAIYTAGDISIAGNGIVNNNATTTSDSVGIWGTNTTAGAQSISIAGNGSLACTCYAPNANLSAKGGGNSGAIYGAFVAYTVTMTGNDSFHYDENLGNLGGTGSFNPTKWRELVTSTDRSTYASNLNF